MANITITRNKTLPNSSDKSDFHDLVDTATATISGIEQTDLGAGIGTVAKQATAPSDTDQIWVDTSVTPYIVRIHDGTEWIATGGYAVMTNKSGGQRVLGDVCIIDTANAGAFKTTTLQCDPSHAVVVMETIDDNSDGVVAISGGRVTNLKMEGAINPGEWIAMASTATNGVKGFHNPFAVALATLTGAGTLSEALLASKSYVALSNASIPAAGTSGQFLKTLGAGANPLWDDIATSDSVALSTLKIRAINFNGSSGSTTVNKTIGGSHTAVRNALGQWTITWASAFSDVYYIVNATGAGQTSQPGDFYLTVTDKTTTTCKIWALNSGGGAVDIVSGQVDVHAIGT